MRLLTTLQIVEMSKLERIIDSHILKQNDASSELITIFISYIKDPKRQLKEDDLSDLVEIFETTLHFVVKDIDRHRKQHTPAACFMTLYPWAYDMDLVDMRIIMNNDLHDVIGQFLKKDA